MPTIEMVLDRDAVINEMASALRKARVDFIETMSDMGYDESEIAKIVLEDETIVAMDAALENAKPYLRK